MISLVEALNAGRRPFVRQQVPAAPTKVIQGDFRKTIIAPGGPRRIGDFADDLGKMLCDELIYLRAGAVWYFCELERKLILMDADTFVGWLEQHVVPVKETFDDEGGRSIEPCSVGKTSLGSVLKVPQFKRHLKQVRMISEVPVPAWIEGEEMPRLLVAGERPTFYGQWGLLLVTPPEGKIEIDEEMTAQEGLAWFEELCQDFPHRAEDVKRDRAVVLAGMLTTFCELLFPPGTQRPVFVVNANAPGSGKTTLMRLILAPVYGSVAVTPPPRGKDDTETEKVLAALAFEGANYVMFDNCKDEIGGAAMEALISARQFKARLLGKSETLLVPNRLLFCFTGNGAELTDDMKRRTLEVRLFMEEVSAEFRTIHAPLEEEDILRHRGKILSMLWAIVREWAASGRAVGQMSSINFPAWAGMIGGMIEAVGCANPLTPPCHPDSNEHEWRAFEALLALALDEVGRDTRLMKSGALMEFARLNSAFTWLAEEKPEDEKKRIGEAAKWGAKVQHYRGRKFPNGCSMDWDADGAQTRVNRQLLITRA